MLQKLKILISFIKYHIRAKTKYGIHSPFVFEFITKVLEDKNYYVSYHKVSELRKRLLANHNLIEIVDFGTGSGSKGYTTHLEKVRNIAKRSAISAKEGQLLHRIVKYFNPEIMLEMGTSLGISSIYQVSGAPDSFFIGMEGCATTAAIAKQNISKITADNNYSMVIGNFKNMLPSVLEKLDFIDYVFLDGNHAYEPTMNYFRQILPFFQENSIMIIHDIHWSTEMEKAWKEITREEKVSVSIDLFTMGIIFFRKGIPKQDFIIRF